MNAAPESERILILDFGAQYAQLIARRVREQNVFGQALCRVTEANGLFAGVPSETVVWMSHGDQVQAVNGQFVPLAATETCPVAAVRHSGRPVYGLQFHPEVSHTPAGGLILRNFLYGVCGCRGLWQIGSFREQTVADLRKRIGDGRVICGLSGGV